MNATLAWQSITPNYAAKMERQATDRVVVVIDGRNVRRPLLATMLEATSESCLWEVTIYHNCVTGQFIVVRSFARGDKSGIRYTKMELPTFIGALDVATATLADEA